MGVKHKDTDGYRLTDGIMCMSSATSTWHYISVIHREQLSSWDAVCLNDIKAEMVFWGFVDILIIVLFLIILTEVIV